MEILNATELAKVIDAVSGTDGHAGLIDAIRTRYAGSEFVLVATRAGWNSGNKGLVDADGNHVSADFAAWVTQEYEAAGRDTGKVWEKYKNAGLLMTEYHEQIIYVAAPYASDEDAFMHIEIVHCHEEAVKPAFDASSRDASPKDLNDLKYPSTGKLETILEISPWRYEFKGMINVRRFLQRMRKSQRSLHLEELPATEQKVVRVMSEQDLDDQVPGESLYIEPYPDCIEQPLKDLRIFQDWQVSSAGRSGARLCDHWFLRFVDCENNTGKREVRLDVQWADGDGGLDLPEISDVVGCNSYMLKAALDVFDVAAGYPFAWFFYMCHGNRIDFSAGEEMALALKAGKIRLPEHDEEVLLRWCESPYGL